MKTMYIWSFDSCWTLIEVHGRWSTSFGILIASIDHNSSTLHPDPDTYSGYYKSSLYSNIHLRRTSVLDRYNCKTHAQWSVKIYFYPVFNSRACLSLELNTYVFDVTSYWVPSAFLFQLLRDSLSKANIKINPEVVLTAEDRKSVV